MEGGPFVRIITGPVNSGKSTLMRTLIDRETAGEGAAGGFLTRPVFGEGADAGRKRGFLIELLPGGRTLPLAGSAPAPGSTPVGRFHLYREGLEAGLESVRRAVEAGSGIIVLDEIGPAELAGEGHAEALRLALERGEGEVWICLREELLSPFLSFLAPRGFRVRVEQPFFRGGIRRGRPSPA